MKFEDYWQEVGKENKLPDTAIMQIPDVLSNDTKQWLMRLSPIQTAEIITAAVDEINKGSIETLDALVNKKL